MKFEDNFIHYEIPKILNDLFTFQNENNCFRMYSKGFGLRFENYDNFFSDKFNKTFIPFATANSTGSTYGFWINGSSINLVDFPIVMFGDEGGINLVAENIFILLSNLTLDMEPYIEYYSNAISFDNEDYEKSEFLDKYKNWLHQNNIAFTNKSIDELDKEIKLIQNKNKLEFEIWKKKYHDNI
jgi:hypothetical protein